MPETNEDGLTLRTQIDPYNLELEWFGHSEQVENWAKKAAEKHYEYDEAKSNLEVTKAELAAEIRNAPEAFDLKKLTEAAVSETVLLQPEYKAAIRKANKAKYEMKLAEAAVLALEHRKRALTKSVDLWFAGYFSTPQSASAPSHRMHELTEEQQKKIYTRGKRRIEAQRAKANHDDDEWDEDDD